MTMPCTYKDYKGDKKECGMQINYDKATKTATDPDGQPHRHRWQTTATVEDVKQEQNKAKQSLLEYNQKFPKQENKPMAEWGEYPYPKILTKLTDLETRVNDIDSHVIGLLAYIKTLTDTTYGADVTDRVTILSEENAQLKIALKNLQIEKGYKNADGSNLK